MAETLTEADFGLMRDLLAMVGSPDDTGAAGTTQNVLAALASLIRCDAVSFNDFDAPRATQYRLDGFEDGVFSATGCVHDDDDPFFRHFPDSAFCNYPNRTGDTRTITMLSDFYSSHEWHRTPMYVDVFRADGIDHELMCPLTEVDGRSSRVVLFRGVGPDFTERDRLVLSLLRPHLLELQAFDTVPASSVSGVSDAPAATALTPRQRELLALVAAGQSTAEIAAALFLSTGTVRKHLDNIFERLGVTNRSAAVMRVFGQA